MAATKTTAQIPIVPLGSAGPSVPRAWVYGVQIDYLGTKMYLRDVAEGFWWPAMFAFEHLGDDRVRFTYPISFLEVMGLI